MEDQQQQIAASAPTVNSADPANSNIDVNQDEQNVPVNGAGQVIDYGRVPQQPPWMPYMSYQPGVPLMYPDPLYSTAAQAQQCGPMLPDAAAAAAAAFYYMQYQQHMAAAAYANGMPPPPPLHMQQQPTSQTKAANTQQQQQQQQQQEQQQQQQLGSYLVNPYLPPPPPSMVYYSYCCPPSAGPHGPPQQQQPPTAGDGESPVAIPQLPPAFLMSPPVQPQLQPLFQVPISVPPPPLQTPQSGYNINASSAYSGYNDYHQQPSCPPHQQHQQQQQQRYSNNRPQSVPADNGSSATRQPHCENQQAPFPMTPRRKNGYMHNILYKTELCRDVQEKGACPRGKTCQFAHNPAELHDPRKHPLYKTAFCFDYKNRNFCPRGPHCFHVHDVCELKMPPVFAPPPPPPHQQQQQQPVVTASAIGNATPRRANRFRRRNAQQQQQQQQQQPEAVSSVEGAQTDAKSENPNEAAQANPASQAETPFSFLMKKLQTGGKPASADCCDVGEKTDAVSLDKTWALEPVRGAQ